MGWVKVIEVDRPKVRARLAIAGFAGVAGVGERSIYYLTRALGASEIASVYSEHIMLSPASTGISVNKDGSFDLPSVKVYYTDSPEPLLLVTCPVQPATLGQMEVAQQVMDLLRERGVEELIVITGLHDEDRAGQVLVFGEDEELVSKLVSAGARRGEPMRTIVGLAGVLLALAKLEGLAIVSVTGASEDAHFDPRATREVLRVLSRAMNLGVDLAEVDREVQVYEEFKRTILREIERQILSSLSRQRPPETDYVG